MLVIVCKICMCLYMLCTCKEGPEQEVEPYSYVIYYIHLTCHHTCDNTISN